MYNKQKKAVNSQKSGKSFLLTSLHSIVICAMILVSFCFAWFTGEADMQSGTIQAAAYKLMAEVSGNGTTITMPGESKSVDSAEYLSFEVENGQAYDISLTSAEGSSAGYCVVSAGDNVYYTPPINGESEGFKFRIMFRGTGSSKIALIPYWGVYPNTLPEDAVMPKDIIENNGRYVVSDGDMVVSPGDSVVTLGDNR